MSKRKREVGEQEVVEHTCGICLEECTEAVHGNGCAHTFCRACLKKWAAQKRTTEYPCCPICRTTFDTFEGDGTSVAVEAQEPDLPPLPLHDVLDAVVQRLVHLARQDGHRGDVQIHLDLGDGAVMRVLARTILG